MRHWRQCACLIAAVWIASTGRASAAPIVYGDYFGLNPGDVDFLQVKENSITDPLPLFEAPTHVNNRLVFSPTGFASYSANGVADTTSGTLSMRIRADLGQFLKQIIIQEDGDATLLGIGNAATSATINGLMVLTDAAPATHGTLTSQLIVTPAAPYRLPGDGFVQFSAVTKIDLTGLNISEVILNFNNNLQTTSQSGTTAYIQKKKITVMVPEPGSASIILLGSFLVLRRRKRRSVS